MSEIASPPGRGPGAGLAALVPQRSAGLKLILVCALALLMAIPALFVYGVVYERSTREQAAVADVSQRFGGAQSVLGPVLAVPWSRTPDPKKPDAVEYGFAIAYAETGTASADVAVEPRRRGLYTVPVFDAELDLEAVFDPAALRNAVPRDATAFWADARLYLGISDNRGVKDAFRVTANGRAVAIEPAPAPWSDGSSYAATPQSGVNLAGGAVPNLETLETPLRVTAALRFTGADRFAVGPFAKDTTLEMRSDWPDPSFTGGVLPEAHTAGGENGFEASWRVPYLARGIPGAGARLSLHDVTNWDNRDMAVRFINDTSPYQSVQRALKYAVMFIGFVFLAYFLFEVTSGARAHPAQYVLVGLAQSIFYLLLLAVSERLGFDVAFGVAAGMTILLTATYAASVFRSAAYGLRAFGILSGIYALMYVLMRAEDHALLAGAFASFAAIALTMWMTRNVEWYGGAAAR